VCVRVRVCVCGGGAGRAGQVHRSYGGCVGCFIPLHRGTCAGRRAVCMCAAGSARGHGERGGRIAADGDDGRPARHDHADQHAASAGVDRLPRPARRYVRLPRVPGPRRARRQLHGRISRRRRVQPDRVRSAPPVRATPTYTTLCGGLSHSAMGGRRATVPCATPSNYSGCAVGDLSGKYGVLVSTGAATETSVSATDSTLTLNGLQSVLGRAVVVRARLPRGPAMDCHHERMCVCGCGWAGARCDRDTGGLWHVGAHAPAWERARRGVGDL
jgi:hypothetical protein